MFNTLEPNQIINFRKSQEYILIDLRSKLEFQNDGISGSINIPYQNLPENLHLIASNKNVVFVCDDGNMSGAARNWVKGFAKFNNVFALENGIKELHMLLERRKAG